MIQETNDKKADDLEPSPYTSVEGSGATVTPQFQTVTE